MARTKLKRLIAIKALNNVFSLKDPNIRKSLIDYFNSPERFTLEIGCGHGDYSVELAKIFPHKNFVGIDVKAARIYHGALRAINHNLFNVAFVISRAENLSEIFPQKSLEEIYIPFPDPHIRRANHNRRLISHDFLKIYRQLLVTDGRVHFKTDNQELYEYVLEIIGKFGCNIIINNKDLYATTAENISSNVKTSFESHYIKQGRVIYYLCFQF